MHSEYLLFNVLVAGSVIISLFFVPRPYWVYRWHALLATTLAAIPFLVWDILVTGRHWDFNHNFTLPYRFLGLPLGEWLFFWTVPLACLFTWETALAPLKPASTAPGNPKKGSWAPLYVAIALFIISTFATDGQLEYTALATASLALVIVLDFQSRRRLFAQAAFRRLLATVVVFTEIFNGYLTARPVVTYGRQYQLDFRIGTIPVEDFVYGLALIALATWLYESLKALAPRSVDAREVAALAKLRDALVIENPLGLSSHMRERLKDWVQKRLGPYRRQVLHPDSEAPLQVTKPHRVAIVGGGLAGLRAATILAQRGVEVHVYEKQAHLGGKIGAWSIEGPDGQEFGIEHGFHAFFPHYYNTLNFLEEVGARSYLRPVGDYLILSSDGRSFSYKDIAKTPLLNLWSLKQQGHFRLRDLIFRPRVMGLMSLLKYDQPSTFASFDKQSFADFAQRNQVPPSLRLTFNSFSRAFFAPPDRMSMAELLKSFHFFFLGHDGGLLYDHPDRDYQSALIGPILRQLDAAKAKTHLKHQVTGLEALSQGIRVQVQGPKDVSTQVFDDVIVACDIKGLKGVLTASPQLCKDYPEACDRLQHLECSGSYAVWRIWLDQAAPSHFGSEGRPLPNFVITDQKKVLDSISFYDRFERGSQAWVQSREGEACVLELHSYHLSEDYREHEACKKALWEDFTDYFPALKNAQILHEEFALNNDFPAFFVGQHAFRPQIEGEIPHLYFAGDWVCLPYPAMLMEAATMSGILAANAILDRLGCQIHPVESIPPRGIFA